MTTRLRDLLTALALTTLVTACGAAAPTAVALPMPDRSVAMDAVDGIRDGSRGGLGGHAAAQEASRIIRTGSISIEIEQYGNFRDAVDERLAASGGRIADLTQSNHAGAVGYASMTLRVPSSDIDGWVAWLEANTEVQHVELGALDVTEQWIDTEARLANAHRTEERLAAILADEAATLADVLAVERELARVRGEIESTEARMRELTNRVEMATITLNVRVDTPYDPANGTTMTDRIGDTWNASLDALALFGEGTVLLAVALVPWLGPLGVLALVAGLAIRALARRFRS